MDNGGRWLLIVGIAGGTTSYTVEVGHRYPIAYEVDCTSQQLKVSFSGSGSSTWDGTFEEIGIEFGGLSDGGNVCCPGGAIKHYKCNDSEHYIPDADKCITCSTS